MIKGSRRSLSRPNPSVSIPDLYQRWADLYTDRKVVKVWRTVPFCPTLLDKPTSSAPADGAARR